MTPVLLFALAQPALSDSTSTEASPRRAAARAVMSGKVSAGASYWWVHGVPFRSGELLLGIGARKKAAAYVTLEGVAAESEFGLRAYGAHVGLLSELPVGWARFGAQGRGGFLSIERVTKASNLTEPSLGLRLHASADVLPLSAANAIYLEAFARVEFYNTWVLNPGLALGIRLEGAPKPEP